MKLIIANWKSNKNLASAKTWLADLSLKIRNSKFEVVIAPPVNLLYLFKEVNNISLAVQDLSPYPAGSYTGAISAHNLEDFNIKYAILGHSERRRYFHETDQDVAKKVAQAIENKIIPLLCINEEYLLSQYSALDEKLASKCVVVYEPLSAIGSGDNAPVSKVLEIKKRVAQLFGQVKFIYGGSVNANNVQDYLAITDGVLVGGASLEVEGFNKIISSNYDT